MSKELPSPPPEIIHLQETTIAAFKAIVEDDANNDLLGRFRFTYEARSQQPWLPESGGKLFQTKSLAGALGRVLYEFNRPTQTWIAERNNQLKMYKEVDEKFKQELLEARDEAVSDWETPSGLFFWFAYYLKQEVVNLNQVTPDKLYPRLINGMNFYWENTYNRGYSGNPW